MLDPVEYARELKRQVEEREKEKNKKKEEQERYDRKKEEECANYNPWGRGGAGAPLKDAQVSTFWRYFTWTLQLIVCKRGLLLIRKELNFLQGTIAAKFRLKFQFLSSEIFDKHIRNLLKKLGNLPTKFFNYRLLPWNYHVVLKQHLILKIQGENIKKCWKAKVGEIYKELKKNKHPL